jgi:hypothetical protein
VSSGAVPGSAQEPAFAASDAPASSLTRGLSEPPEIEIRVVDVAADSIPKPRRVTDPYFGAETRKAKQAPAPKSAQTATPLHDSRRIHRRASYLTPVHVLREGGHGFDARCEDISEGGMLLIGPQVIEDAESIEVRFALPITGEVVTTPATSRWVRAAREGRGAIGVQFLDLSPAARENIANYVQFFSYDA